MEYVHLVGVEQIQNAANTMRQAADSMNRSASEISSALHNHGMIMRELIAELNRLEREGEGGV